MRSITLVVLLVSSVCCVLAHPLENTNNELITIDTIHHHGIDTLDEYWTTHRMAKAQPLLNGVVSSLSGVRRHKPSVSDRLVDIDPIGASGEEMEGKPWPTNDGNAVQTHGRLFFVTPEGKDTFCTATVTASESLSLLLTSGNCVHQGSGGSWFDRFVFVPGYSASNKDGGRYHKWLGKYRVAMNAFIDTGDLGSNLGAVILYPFQDKRIVNVTGAQGIKWGIPKEIPVWHLGYKGDALHFCNGTGQEQPTDKTIVGLACGLPADAQGGSILADYYGQNPGKMNSVHGHRYAFGGKQLVLGPYFDSRVAEMYNLIRYLS